MSKKKEIDLNVLEVLYKKYKFSTNRLAEVFDCSPKTIQRRLKELGYNLLKAQNRDEFGRIHSNGLKHRPQTRDNNGKFKGGISIYRTLAFNDYELPKECFHCKTDQDIIIHHINKNRYDNSKSNLRPVCRSCHMKKEHPDSIQKAQEAKKLKREKEAE